jgi:P27 family predicted phage terminase small subunit
MAARGRKPKPEALTALHGRPGKQPKRSAAEPQAPAGDMSCPASVKAVKGAAAYWRHFIEYAPLGILRPVDIPDLSKLCIEHAMGDEASRQIKSNGYVITTSTGTLIQSPWVGIFHRSTEIARKLASELGLTVTARARLDAPVPLPPAGTGKDDDDQTPAARGGGDELDRYLDQDPERTIN